MEDYKEIIKKLLSGNFTPTTTRRQPKFLSTTAVLRMVQGVIPRTPIDEHDIFEVLTEMRFKKNLKTFYIKDKEGKDTKEIDFQVYLWAFFDK
ncbi:conserved hypothetical protein [Tenacibaculum maritimum]|uniref:hypothetical protein n=1 Tax=Tenacibaculum maritimum TaxID=107401 RepID=UPI0012E40580|nr:hypothetical protein [Tenacibaculum maritimum]CAA0172244.1 conserved hypothetical protein [Tenacibaculum maritimum]